MRKRVAVKGSSPFATSLAALLAAREQRVVLAVDEHEEDAPPWDLGASRVSGGDEAVLRLAWGELEEVEDRRGLLLGGEVHPLPLGRRGLVEGASAEALGDLLRVRVRRRMGRVVALGREVRTYRDFVVDRLGEGLYQGLFGPWARKRYAADPGALAASVAFLDHGREAEGPWYAPRRPWAEVLAVQLAAAERVVDSLEPRMEGGRLVALMVGEERLEVDAFLTETHPAEAQRWVGEVGPRERWDLDRLRAAHAVQVTLPAEVEHLPWVTHVPEPSRPFWRLSRPGRLPGEGRWRGHLTAHLTLDEADPLWRADDEGIARAVRRALVGVADPRRGAAVVQRRRRAVPRPAPTSPVALGHRLEALDAAGIALVGTAGAFRILQPAAALAHADALWEPDALAQRQVHRDLLEREVRLPDRASPRGFSTA